MSKIKEQVEILYKAIKEEDKTVAYNSFNFLAGHFKIDYNQFLSELTSEIFSTSKYGTVYDVDWDALAQRFLEILNKYKTQTTLDRDMPLIELDNIINELTERIEKLYETDCLVCGTKIRANETKCSKCGWGWNNKSTESQPFQ